MSSAVHIGSLAFGMAASVVAAAAIAGCATGDFGELDTPANELGTRPPPAPDRDGGRRMLDSGPADTGTSDSSENTDAADGGDSSVPDGACPVLNATRSRACGMCGQAISRCIDNGRGNGTWSAYGACTGEVADGCTPGSVKSEPCGACGTVTKTCNNACAYATTACSEPASCSTGVLNVPFTVGGTNSQIVTLSTAQVGTRIRGACPATLEPLVGPFTYQYTEVKNSTGHPATVTIYVSQAAGGPLLDTTMVAYNGTVRPADAASQKACNFGVSDTSEGYLALTGYVDFPILTSVPVAAGASIQVNVMSFSALSAGDAKTTGAVKLNVRTDQLN